MLWGFPYVIDQPQWSRSLKAAERGMPGEVVVPTHMVPQWSRSLKAAESGHLRQPHEERPVAAMEPQPEGRGEEPRNGQRPRRVPAAMEPQPEGCGEGCTRTWGLTCVFAGLCERRRREGAGCRAVGLCRAFRASLTWARVLPGARVTTGPLAGCSVLWLGWRC
jgi:hypothetical protein